MLFFSLLIVGMVNAQQSLNNSKQEEKIRSLVSQMTLQEKVTLCTPIPSFMYPG